MRQILSALVILASLHSTGSWARQPCEDGAEVLSRKINMSCKGELQAWSAEGKLPKGKTWSNSGNKEAEISALLALDLQVRPWMEGEASGEKRKITCIDASINATHNGRDILHGYNRDVPAECFLGEEVIFLLKGRGRDLEMDSKRNTIDRECVEAASTLGVELDYMCLVESLLAGETAEASEALALLELPGVFFQMGISEQEDLNICYLPIEMKRWGRIEWDLESQRERMLDLEGRQYLELTLVVTGGGEYTVMEDQGEFEIPFALIPGTIEEATQMKASGEVTIRWDTVLRRASRIDWNLSLLVNTKLTGVAYPDGDFQDFSIESNISWEYLVSGNVAIEGKEG